MPIAPWNLQHLPKKHPARLLDWFRFANHIFRESGTEGQAFSFLKVIATDSHSVRSRVGWARRWHDVSTREASRALCPRATACPVDVNGGHGERELFICIEGRAGAFAHPTRLAKNTRLLQLVSFCQLLVPARAGTQSPSILMSQG